jgi:hypothetical protein
MSGVRVILSNYNFTYTSKFTTLGIEGQAQYYFAGTVQAAVSSLHKLSVWLGAEQQRSAQCLHGLAGGPGVRGRLWRAWHLQAAGQPACVQLRLWV